MLCCNEFSRRPLSNTPSLESVGWLTSPKERGACLSGRLSAQKISLDARGAALALCWVGVFCAPFYSAGRCCVLDGGMCACFGSIRGTDFCYVCCWTEVGRV